MYEELISAHPCRHLLFVVLIIAMPGSGILCFDLHFPSDLTMLSIFTCLLAIFISSLEKCQFRFLAHF